MRQRRGKEKEKRNRAEEWACLDSAGRQWLKDTVSILCNNSRSGVFAGKETQGKKTSVKRI